MTPAAQLEKLDRLCEERLDLYGKLEKRGKMTAATAAEKQRELETVRRSFAWFIKNLDWIIIEDARRKAAADMAATARDPLAVGLLELLPDGTAVTIKKRPAFSIAASDTPAGSRPDAADDHTSNEDL